MSFAIWEGYEDEDKDNVKTCEHFIGYSLDTRAESFDKYYLNDEIYYLSSTKYIDVKFDYCPWCGERIDWQAIREMINEE